MGTVRARVGLATEFRALVFAVLCSLACAKGAFGQRLQTETFEEREGLPGASVTDVVQTQDGCIWIATRSGIACFDGSLWTTYYPGAGLPEEFSPRFLVNDSGGGLWAHGARGHHGLLNFDGERWSKVGTASAENPDAVCSSLALVESGSGDIRIAAVLGAAIHLHENGAWAALPLSRPSLRAVPRTVQGDGSVLYIGTSHGVERLESGESQAREVLDDSGDSTVVLDVYAEMQADGSNRLWLATQEWFGYHENGETHQLAIPGLGTESRPHWDPIILPDGRGGAYLGLANSLRHHNVLTGQTSKLGLEEGLIENGATVILRDRDQNLWIGNRRGLTRIPPQRFENFGAAQGLLEDEVTSILQLKPGALALGHRQGISITSKEDIKFVRLKETRKEHTWPERVMDLELMPDGSVWAALAASGLIHFDATGRIISAIESEPRACIALCLSAQDNLLIGTTHGLMSLEGSRLVPVPSPFDGINIRRLLRSSDGTVCVAAIGVGLFFLRDGAWIHAETAPEARSLEIFSLHEGNGGKLWIGALSGLFYLSGNRIERHTDGFEIHKPAYSILETPGGSIWIGSSSGTYRWDDGEVEHFGVHEGIAGPEANRDALIMDEKGRVWIGTNSGVSMYVENSKRIHRALEVQILELRGPRPGAEGDALLLGHRGRLACQFRVVTFDGDRKSLYRARLLGLSDEWSEPALVGNGILQFDDLPAGDYQLELQARRRTGDWGPVARSAPLRVKTALWMRGWFVGLVALSLTSLLISFGRARSRRRGLQQEVSLSRHALEQSWLRHGEMFQQNPANLLLVEPRTGRVIEANTAAAKYFGVSVEEACRQTLTGLCGITADDLATGFSRLEANGDWIATAPSPIEDGGPPIVIRMSLLHLGDETIVQATVQETSLAQHLEDQLEEAQKMQAVGELAAGVAHDFNNLLTAIMGNNSLIEADSGDLPTTLERSERIREASERGAILVKHLLTLAREQQINFEDLGLNPIARNVTAILQSVLGSRITVAHDLDDSIGRVHADRTQLERVMINLTLNARDAMPDGGEFTLQTRMASRAELDALEDFDDSDWPYVRLTLKDTGAGMTREQLDKIFQPFYSAHSSGKRIGLGLSSVKSTIRHHGGFTRVESAPGTGTSVHIYLPLVEAAEHTQSAALPVAGPAQATNDEARRTVLLVDDDDSVRHTVSQLLTQTGYRVIESESADAARRAFAAEGATIELLLTDLNLPGLNGQQLGVELRKLKPSLKVLLMSGSLGELGGKDEFPFISKPFSVVKLGEALMNTQLATGRGGEAPRES